MSRASSGGGGDPSRAARVASARLGGDDQAARRLGLDVLAVAPGRATVRMVVGQEMLNGLGVCHGGVIFTLADTALAHASNSHGVDAMAVSASIDFVAPGRSGATLTAEAVEQHRAGRTALYEVSVTADDGSLVARFHGRTQQLRSPPDGSA